MAEEDVGNKGPGEVAGAIGEAAESLYRSGTVAQSKLPSLNAWLTKEGCMFPDIIESLAMGHLEKGDQMSAMITSEWYSASPFCNNAWTSMYSLLQQA